MGRQMLWKEHINNIKVTHERTSAVTKRRQKEKVVLRNILVANWEFFKKKKCIFLPKGRK